jgi:hypothetical protein
MGRWGGGRGEQGEGIVCVWLIARTMLPGSTTALAADPIRKGPFSHDEKAGEDCEEGEFGWGCGSVKGAVCIWLSARTTLPGSTTALAEYLMTAGPSSHEKGKGLQGRRGGGGKGQGKRGEQRKGTVRIWLRVRITLPGNMTALAD